MSHQLILIRGLPGSGKTTLAKKLIKDLNCAHYEADMFFEDALGNYCYEAGKIGDAHRWCQQQTRKALREGRTVIVSNTFICQREMDAYREMARMSGAQLQILICDGEYQNIHQVPDETIQKMKENWED